MKSANQLFVFHSPNFDRFKWAYLLVTPVADEQAAWKAVSEKTGWGVKDLKEVIKVLVHLDLPSPGPVEVLETQQVS